MHSYIFIIYIPNSFLSFNFFWILFFMSPLNFLISFSSTSSSSSSSLPTEFIQWLPWIHRYKAIHWSMVNLPETILIEKTDSPYPCSINCENVFSWRLGLKCPSTIMMSVNWCDLVQATRASGNSILQHPVVFRKHCLAADLTALWIVHLSTLFLPCYLGAF